MSLAALSAEISADLVFGHRGWLISILSARLRGNLPVAEDLFSNIVTEIAAGQHDLSRVQRLEPWLYRLAVNKATDWLRRERRWDSAREEIAGQATLGEGAAAAPLLPLDALMRDELAACLRAGLDALDPGDAELLELKYLHEWSYAQIEKHLGMSWHQIAHRLRVARQRLRAVLAAAQPELFDRS